MCIRTLKYIHQSMHKGTYVDTGHRNCSAVRYRPNVMLGRLRYQLEVSNVSGYTEEL